MLNVVVVVSQMTYIGVAWGNFVEAAGMYLFCLYCLGGSG
jgi:hypothetical protein